ncbi:CG17048 [Drosophila busckii]|uniref:CG17048 n=1 Tax=Drosophila busckii TaxID=30019 RepID=A0A0M4EBX7_DROBS|nr:E3 ubiquitin-protein ligase RNF125 [Drosophila busckii]ALC41127.1 CG17048 [Drosophila busckii]
MADGCSHVLQTDVDVDLDAELCAFCLDRLHNPVQLRCKHSFCRSCLQLYSEARDWSAKRCPLCRRCLTLDELRCRRVASAWRLTILLSIALLTFSLGPFGLLLVYW